MAAISGKYAAFFRSYGSSVAATGEAMTQVGSTLEYYIADRTKRLWDPAYAVTVKDGGVAITAYPYTVDHAGGYVTLTSTPAGAVTVDCYYKTIEALGGGYEWSLNPKADTKECTVFSSTLNSPAAWREFAATVLSWDGSVKQHWFYGRASKTYDTDLIWTWRAGGTDGNLENIEYATGGALEIARAGHDTTVTLNTGVTTAADIKAHVEADATLNALWQVEYAVPAAKAYLNVDCTNPNSDLTWTWRTAGVVGNSKSVEYLVAGNNTPLTVTYAADTVTVNVATSAIGAATSTANDIHAAVEATVAVRNVIRVANSTSNDGTGIVEAKVSASLANGTDAGTGVANVTAKAALLGGRDSGEEIAKLGTKIMCEFYQDLTTGSYNILRGVGTLVGVPVDCQLEGLVESDLSFTGTGRLRYHTV